jgi:hypothetical protein
MTRKGSEVRVFYGPPLNTQARGYGSFGVTVRNSSVLPNCYEGFSDANGSRMELVHSQVRRALEQLQQLSWAVGPPATRDEWRPAV